MVKNAELHRFLIVTIYFTIYRGIRCRKALHLTHLCKTSEKIINFKNNAEHEY